MSSMTFLRPIVVTASLLASLSVPGVGFADDYSWMLGVLNDNRIDGQVGSGASGNMSINSAAGDGNLQANQRVLQQGGALWRPYLLLVFQAVHWSAMHLSFRGR